MPKVLFQRQLHNLLNQPSFVDDEVLNARIVYYNKLDSLSTCSENAVLLKNFKLAGRSSAYFFDTQIHTRYFPDHLKADFLFGDITYVPTSPSIVKSRPIASGNEYSVLLNLDRYRHFNFIHDPIPFSQKRNVLVWRGDISERKQERLLFLERFYEHPLCDLGSSNLWLPNPQWQKPFMSIKEQLAYKYILCLEGIDVATNLKWVMSSNSVPVMPRPRFETWFMEGTLRPGYHYVEIQDDFSDLEEKLAYYNQHPKEAERIVAQAHSHVRQFLDSDGERFLALKVLERYFLMTGQQIFNI